MAKRTLANAQKVKNDEFYTQLHDIENEMKHYKKHFKGKTIFCNCDDPDWSNFWKYFYLNFEFLGLKKLISTHYDAKKSTYKMIYDGKGEPEVIDLEGNGDFRSPECIELLEQSDIVITNPPFSLFREYVAQLMEYDKKFLIIGNQNAITYKEIFPLIKENKLWLGYGFNAGNAYFGIPEGIDTSKYASGVYNAETGLVKFRNCHWFTNLDHDKRHKVFTPYKTYNSEEYPKYDNYDAINVDKTIDIPVDYNGAMGVPITFLDKYNPEQFEIIKFRKGDDGKDLCVSGKCPYFRILIKWKV